MSTFLTGATARVAGAAGYGAIVNGLGVIAAALLILLLVAQLILRALGGAAGRRANMLDVGIWPLVLVMVVITGLRIAQFLPAG